MTTGFGIVGCGMIAGFHAKAVADAGGRVVACYDQVPAAADAFATREKCVAATSLEELVRNPEIQIVTVTTPSGAHLEPALAAARARRHVIIEKPLEVTPARCQQIIDACNENGVTVTTIFQSRFHEASRTLKRAVDAGRFGKLTLGSAFVRWFRTQQYYDSGAWRGTWELDGGGALMNQAIHSLDLLIWLMGDVRRVQASTALLAHERIAVEDTAVATLEFANGALGVIEASTASYPGYLKRVEISGSHGSAVLEEEDIVKWDFLTDLPEDVAIRTHMSSRKSGGGGAADPAAIGHHGHTLLFRDVIDAIKDKRSPQVDGFEGRRSVDVIAAIYEAAKTGSAVVLC
ncbi:MAG: Gfo/Idh/MocA family protein [Thermoguttaceae bacterium]